MAVPFKSVAKRAQTIPHNNAHSSGGKKIFCSANQHLASTTQSTLDVRRTNYNGNGRLIPVNFYCNNNTSICESNSSSIMETNSWAWPQCTLEHGLGLHPNPTPFYNYPNPRIPESIGGPISAPYFGTIASQRGFQLPSINHVTSISPMPGFFKNKTARRTSKPKEVKALIPTLPEVGMVVEIFSQEFGHSLGIVNSIDANSNAIIVDRCELKDFKKILIRTKVNFLDVTFCWLMKYKDKVYHFSAYNLPDLIEQVNVDLEKHRSSIEVIYGAWLDANRSNIRVESVANFLFGENPLPHQFYVAYRLLRESTFYFSSETSYSYALKSLDSMIGEKRRELSLKNEKLKLLFLRRLTYKLINTSQMDDKYDLDKMMASLPRLTDWDISQNLQWNPVQNGDFVAQLRRHAINEPLGEVKELLAPLGLPTGQKNVFDLLVDLNIFHRHENPYLARCREDLFFAPAEMKKYNMQSLSIMRDMSAQFDCDFDSRRDLRGLGPFYTIDSSIDCDEVDDSIGVEYHDGQPWVYVHIADPSRMMQPNDELDLLARRRVSSVFLPEVTISMLPPPFSRHHFSLLPNRANYCLTFVMKVNVDSGEVESYEIFSSLIDNLIALTYDEADEILGQVEPSEKRKPLERLRVHECLDFLFKVSLARKRYRESRGAISMNVPRPEITVKNYGEKINVLPVWDCKSASKGIVSELMIMTGEVAANFAKSNSIPVPFRSQIRRKPHSSPNDTTFQLFKNPANSKPPHLYPARTETEERQHDGLGIPLYCQVTSPIRRYYDLLVHHQIKSILRNERCPFTLNDLDQIITQMNEKQSQLNKLYSNTTRYWILKYLERQNPNREYEALVSGITLLSPHGTYDTSVWLTELGWKTFVHFDPLNVPQEGQKIHLRVSKVDPFQNELLLIPSQP